VDILIQMKVSHVLPGQGDLGEGVFQKGKKIITRRRIRASEVKLGRAWKYLQIWGSKGFRGGTLGRERVKSNSVIHVPWLLGGRGRARVRASKVGFKGEG